MGKLFERIRREYEFGVGTIRGVAHELNAPRRLVRQVLANAEPPERKQITRVEENTNEGNDESPGCVV